MRNRIQGPRCVLSRREAVGILFSSWYGEEYFIVLIADGT